MPREKGIGERRSNKPVADVTTTAVAVLLLCAIGLLIWRAAVSAHAIALHQAQLVEAVVEGAANAITARLDMARQQVGFLAEDNAALLARLAANPADEEVHKLLREKVSHALPTAFAFTLANADGEPVVEDFEGLIGDVCRQDIHQAATQSSAPPPVVHPNPLGYHFDVMHDVALGEGERGIFFVSFGAEVLARSLANHRLPGHDLLLVNRDTPTLIEVSAEGARDALDRGVHLSPAELERIVRDRPLEGTRWRIVALRRAETGSGAGAALWFQTLAAVAALGVIGLASIVSIRRAQRKEARAASAVEVQRARLQAIVNTVAEAIVTVDAKGSIRDFNPAAERIFGYSSGDVIGRNVQILMPEPDRSQHDRYMARYMADGVARLIGKKREVVGQRADGSTFPIELTVTETTVSHRRLFSGTMRDITEAREVERAKKEFVSIVSHELRTPLTSIRGSLGLIGGGAVGNVPEKAQALIKIALGNCERLIGLVNDILDMEKIASGNVRFQFREQPLTPVVESAIHATQGFASQRRVNLALSPVDGAIIVSIDADRIIQVLVNLLSNAVKFSPEAGTVTVSIEHRSGVARVSVADRGPGITAAFRARIFERFAQADASDGRQKEGSGLGLSIAKAIVEEHGGRIDFESTPGRGSTFYFELPAREPFGRPKASPPASAPSPSPHRILVCEHDVEVAALIRRMLEVGGYSADIAHDVEQARQMIAETNYQVITMDLSLRGREGLLFIRELRDQDATRDVPVIVVSAVAQQGKRRLAGAAVAVADWLGRPIDQERLLAAVRSASREAMPHILHVEDDPDLAKVVAMIVEPVAAVRHANTLKEAHAWLAAERFDLVILDVSLPDGSGLSLLSTINSVANPPPVLIFSADEPPADLAPEVATALTKSRTDNLLLLETVNALLAARQPGSQRSSQARQ